MATDLETCRLAPTSTVKISPDHRHHRRRGRDRIVEVFEFDDQGSKNVVVNELGDQGSCRTPISPQHMIPMAISCPPAPKKRRHTDPACKRKLFDLNFFETGAREEVESLFRPTTTVQVNSHGSIKRKFTA